MTAEQLHDYWNGFYAGQASGAVPAGPSAFATWVAGRLDPEATVAEFGFGTARDSFYFAGLGHRVLGFDFAESAVSRAAERAGAGDRVEFEMLDLYDSQACADRAVVLAEVSGLAIYGRFLLHSLEEPGRANLLDLASTALAGGGDLYVEFRTGQDRGHRHVFGDDHYRAYLDPEKVVAAIAERGGEVTVSESGHGLAVYKSEDPHVARIVARFAAVASPFSRPAPPG